MSNINKFRHFGKIIKNGMINSYFFGFGLGFVCPNQINVKYNKHKINIFSMPLVSGCVSLLGFMFFPFIVTNYFYDGVLLDKIIDKYNFNIERYHQYDSTDKYGYPSIIYINIQSITNESNKNKCI